MSWFRRLSATVRSALLDNIGLKSICFASALLLVAYQRGQQDERTRTIAYNIDSQLPPESAQVELMTTLPPHVRVTVQGSARALDELTGSVTTLVLDLRNPKQDYVRFVPEMFDVPPGVTIKFIEPPGLDLEWQRVISRQVAIQPSVTGTVADGHEVARQTVEPEQVQVRGPRSVVRVIQFVRAAPFDITGLSTGSYRRQLALDPPPNRTSYVDTHSATVTVEIRRRLISSSFSGLSVEVVGAPNASAIPGKVDVTVKGPPEVIRGLSSKLVVPRVDLSEIDTSKHGSMVLPVLVDLNRADAEIQPPTVKVSW